MAKIPRFSPIKIRAPHGAVTFEITWGDGNVSRIAHGVLRGYCPCAECQGHHGITRFVGGGNVELCDISRIGNYALGLTWGDGHSGGIFTFEYLRRLGDLVESMGTEALTALDQLPP
jgi:DUF971 family protein